MCNDLSRLILGGRIAMAFLIPVFFFFFFFLWEARFVTLVPVVVRLRTLCIRI
jgi:hypothetical protein